VAVSDRTLITGTNYALYCGDAREVVHEFDPVSLSNGDTIVYPVSMIVCDPPYGTEMGDGTHKGGYGRRQNHDPGTGQGRTIAGDTDLSFLSDLLPHFPRLLNGTGFAAIFHSGRNELDFANVIASHIDMTAKTCQWIGNLIWDKGQPGLGYTIRYAHEEIALLKYGDAKTTQAIMSILRGNCLTKDHPHEKPVDVMKALILFGSQPGDVILDPCCGTGASGVASLSTGRKWVGIEMDPAYVAIAQRRVTNITPPLFSDDTK
jgi:DNA modification methylase